MKIINKLITAVLLLMLSVPAAAQELALTGFVEGAYGTRVQENNLVSRDYLLNELRMQLKLEHFTDAGDFFGSVDFLADNAVKGTTGTSIREAYFRFSPFSFMDVKAGRQVMTWGTGDLVFINDLFPKDYISFFTGREDQYLKAASDALRMSFFSSAGNLEVVVSPEFQADILPTGSRLSFYNPMAGGIIGGDGLTGAPLPAQELKNAEISLRAYRMMMNFQVSGYFYNGFYKTPMGMDPVLGMYFPELAVYGTSLRGQALGGVLNMEYGYYDSSEETTGMNPLIPNSSHKFLIGLDKQLFTDFNLGLQYYGEYMTDHDRYMSTLPVGSPEMDELRNVFTSRMTKMMYYQNIHLSLFTFYSPTDEDWHLRPSISFKYSDQISLAAGGNLFGGEKVYTLFGQFENNNNLYMRLRYNF